MSATQDDVTPQTVANGLANAAAASQDALAAALDEAETTQAAHTTTTVTVAATPEGVPDNYEYVPPGEDVPDGRDTVESPRGATYVAPADGDAGDDEGETEDADGETADSLDDIPDAGPSELAGGVAAAIDDSRDNFHDIRNAITNADTRAEAEEIIESELVFDGEIEDLAAEVERQQEMRENFDVIDDPGNLQFGQPVLYDADRPKRGVVDDIDADGTVWINNAHRDAGGGVNPEYGTLYADPDYDGAGGEAFTAEPGRHGLASNPEVLENAFDAVDEVKGSREAGITGGNTTGDKMKILELDDGSRVFATPVSAYPGTTGVVDDPAEARENNRNSPKVIEALGGTAAKTRITEGPGGEEYIVKEGIPGDTLAEYAQRGGRPSDAVNEAATETMSAAYFVGNVDLHGGNMVVNYDDADVAVIDHDSAGKNFSHYRGVMEIPRISRFTSGTRGVSVDSQEARQSIYEKAQDIRSGDVDLGVSDRSRHAEFAQDAADKAVRAAYVDPTYDLPDDQVPAEVQSPPSGIETIDDFEDPNDVPDDMYPVTYVDGEGDVVEGTVTQYEDQEDRLVIDGSDGIEFISDPNQVVEIV